jgi:hypothetical protein
VPQAKLKTRASSTQIHRITAAPTSFLSIYTYESVARREVFVSVSAFKPKVKNVSPRAWTETIAVLLLLSLLLYELFH